MSGFLKRIDKELGEAPSISRRGELLAQRAGYMARIGAFDSARELIAKLRAEFGNGHSGTVTVWIMMAEALIWHYESLGDQAMDRAKRAKFLSTLMKDSGLIAYSTAWLAHFQFDASLYESSFESLTIAILNTSAENYGANSRISNVVCKAALLCGEVEIERQHFNFARDQALKDGDQASIEALQHNRAAFRLARVRSQFALGRHEERFVSQSRIDLASARSLQALTGVQALASYIALAQARLKLVEEKYEDAIDELSSVRTAGPFPASTFNQELVELELAFCFAKTGQVGQALKHFESSRDLDVNSLDVDDQLAVRWMEHQLADIDEKFGARAMTGDRLRIAGSEYKKMITMLRKKLRALPRLPIDGFNSGSSEVQADSKK